MRVLLIPQKNNYPDPRPCLSIFGQAFPYLAGALKASGHEVFGMNLNYQWCHGSAPLMLEISLRKAIKKYKPDLIGVGGLSADYLFVRDAILFAKQIAPDIPIVCGGGIITYDQHYTFPHLHPDFAVVGEGEETIVRLVDYLEKGGDITTIPNIAYWENGEPIYNKIDYSNIDLGKLPFPDYSPFDFDTYLTSTNQADNYFYAHTRHQPRIMPISMGRSCPYKCTFCCHTIGPKYRARSIANAIEEILYFYKKYKFNILFIYDELFSTKKDRIIEFCTKIKKLKKEFNMDFDWTCDLRVPDVDQDLLKEMKDAGCIFIGYGLESASPTVLKSMKKGTTVQQIIRAIKLTEEAGMGVQGIFIFGDIAETPETIHETVSVFNKCCKNLMVSYNYVVPYPGSEIFQYCLDNNIITDKQQYYETIAWKKIINMTKMPDDIFLKLTDPIVYYKYNDFKPAPVLLCEKIDISACDLYAPFSSRRSYYKIKVTCPHCLKNVDYLYPLIINNNGMPSPLENFCAECHKRFVMTFQKPISESVEKNPIQFSYFSDNKLTTVLLEPFTPILVDSYKGFNFVHYQNRIYALSQDLGPVDLTRIDERELSKCRESGKCIIGSSLDEPKHLVDQLVSQNLIELVEEGHKGFNIGLYRGKYYGLFQGIGPVDIPLIEESKLKEYQEKGKCVIGKSLNEAKQLIDQIVPAVPELVEEGYRGFNIILYKDKYYALAQSIGAVDFFQIKEEELKKYEETKKCFIANSLAEAKTLVDQLTDSSAIKLIEEGYKGFNIVAYNGKYYAVAQSLGSIDFTTADLKTYEDSLQFAVGESIEGTMQFVDKLSIFKTEISDRDSRIEALQGEITNIKATLWFRLYKFIKGSAG